MTRSLTKANRTHSSSHTYNPQKHSKKSYRFTLLGVASQKITSIFRVVLPCTPHIVRAQADKYITGFELGD